MGRGKANQAGEYLVLSAAERRQGRRLAVQRGMEFAEGFFDFHNAACEGNEIIEQGTNLGIETFVGFVVNCSQTKLEMTKIFLILGKHGGESVIHFLLQF